MMSRLPFEFSGEHGFGLMQVVFIMLAVAITASVAVMNSASSERSASPNLTYQRMDQIKEAVTRYRADGNGNPPTLDALVTAPGGATACAPDTNPASANFRKLRGWCGPYLNREAAGSDLTKRDGWKSLLQYNGTTLVSCGPNRTCGDGDDIATTL